MLLVEVNLKIELKRKQNYKVTHRHMLSLISQFSKLSLRRK